MYFQFIWANKGDVIEETTPLVWHGKHLKKMGWENTITLVFLKRPDYLSNRYKENLESLGYKILDCSKIANDIIDTKYPGLKAFSETSKFWFLRWNVLFYLMKEGIAPKHSIHIDGDVVFMSDPNSLKKDVEGKTFVLQGCPAFTSISNEEWLTVWEKELGKFLSNTQKYISLAMEVKHRSITDCGFRISNSCYPNRRFEDQEMLQYLIASGKLLQSRTEDVYDSPFYWIQNPLLPGEWYYEQHCISAKMIIEKKGLPFVGNKQIAFYHFQSNFTVYCFDWMILNKAGLTWMGNVFKKDGKLDRSRLPLSRLYRFVLRRFLRVPYNNRLQIYEMVFQRNPKSGNFFITDIVNSCW